MNPAVAHPAVADAFPLQLWTARPDGMLDFVNTCVTEYFGVPGQQLLDQGWKDLCHPYDLIHATEKWRHSLATGEPYEVHFRLLRGRDKQFRWHLGRASAVRSAAGEILFWAGSNCDIDAVRRSEEVANAQALQARSELDRLALRDQARG